MKENSSNETTGTQDSRRFYGALVVSGVATAGQLAGSSVTSTVCAVVLGTLQPVEPTRQG